MDVYHGAWQIVLSNASVRDVGPYYGHFPFRGVCASVTACVVYVRSSSGVHRNRFVYMFRRTPYIARIAVTSVVLCLRPYNMRGEAVGGGDCSIEQRVSGPTPAFGSCSSCLRKSAKKCDSN